MSRKKTVAVRILAVLLGLLFCAAGLPKVLGGPEVEAQFAGWGYPSWFARIVGVVEFVGGLGLIVPRTARFAALPLVGIMLGAAVTHARFAEWPRVLFVLVLGVLLWLASRSPHLRPDRKSPLS